MFDNNLKVNRSNTKKCQCTFSITILFDDESNEWYLKQKRNSTLDPKYHHNHIWIDPKHLSLSKNTIPDYVSKTIHSLIQSGMNIPSIQLYIKTEYKCNVDYQTLYNLRVNQIDDLIEACSEKPFGSSVDRLKYLFKNTPSVSFVYIIHRYNSGFITFRKNRNESINQYVSHLDNIEKSQMSGRTINNWRDCISLAESNDVLVAFSWAHDDEVKCAENILNF